MTKIAILNKKNPIKVIKINTENPFFKITNITFQSIVKESNFLSTPIYHDVTIKLKQSEGLESAFEEKPLFTGSSIPMLGWDGKVPFNTILIDSNKFNKIELIYKNTNKEDFEVKVHYDILNNNVSVVNPFENFKRHIEQNDNAKILFSAPFGQGKTTFLNHFFEKHPEEYEVFKVFPVNYSISHNEDVFKYIKAEILFQLLGKNVEFDKESFSYFLTAPQFFKNNAVRVLSPLIMLFPKIGKSAYDVFDKFYSLAEKYFDYHDKAKINDKSKASKFIKELYETEGSIFEDNFYTQLIRQLLEKLKLSSKKKNVLIIEDLDRMDPDHIFRILNIFASHFDAPEYDDGYSNKFGFDKIIIVGDYNNIKHTFAYRYGPHVDFSGYINKYYSKEPFFYNNKEAIAELIRELRNGFPQNKSYIGLELFFCVLNDLVSSESITLRDLIKLLKIDAVPIVSGQFQKSIKTSKHFYNRFIYFNLLYYLSKAFDVDSLIQKFEECKNKHSKLQWNYGRFANFGLPSLVEKEPQEKGNYELKYKLLTLTFILRTQWEPPPLDISYFEIDALKSINIVGDSSVNFSRSDFYEILILNTKKYKEVGGFD